VLEEVVQLEDNLLKKNKEVQLALRQILGVYVTTDRNLKGIFDGIFDGISLGILVSCTTGELHNLNNLPILKKCLPHVLKLCEIISSEMNRIIYDDNLDQVTVLATKVLETILQSNCSK